MSAVLVPSDAINDALIRAKELAAQGAGAKRAADASPEDYPAKRSNAGMDGAAAGMNIGMPIGLAGPGMTAPSQLDLGQMGQLGGGGNIVEIIAIPDHTVGLVIGRGGEQISQIQAQSGARVQMSQDSEGTGQRQCTIQGSKMSVERAKQLISEIINRAGNRPPPGGNGVDERPVGGPGSITTELLIPGPKCGLIIGKQGETIRQLQEQAGVKMVMIQESHGVSNQPKPLRITGDPEKIELAKRLINEILNSRDDAPAAFGRGFHDGSAARGEVVVPRASVGMIIGKGGETIKRLGLETGTKIQFKPDEDPTAQDRTAVITGSREQIYKATELITDLVTKSMAGGAGNDTFYMHVPANKTGLVIGKGGETIKQICAASNAHCELSRDPTPNDTEKVFVIKGTPYQIHHAQHIIRIKVGDVAPGTPVPPFTGPGGPTQQPTMQYQQQSAGGYGGAHFGQQMQANQWNSSGFGQQPAHANGWPQQQQMPYFDATQQNPNVAAQTAMYAGMQTAAVSSYGQQPQYAAAAAAAKPAASAQPATASAVNPQTGQPDYSAQWAEYYRNLGMHEQAAMIENQLKQNQGRGVGVASAQPAAPAQAYAASQPQQYAYSQAY